MTMKKQHKLINVELSELANGAIQEKLDHALKDVMTNILDPNTEAKKKRKNHYYADHGAWREPGHPDPGCTG